MRRGALALALITACHSPPPTQLPAPAVVGERTPLDALSEEATHRDLPIRVTRNGAVLYERKPEALVSIELFTPTLLQVPAVPSIDRSTLAALEPFLTRTKLVAVYVSLGGDYDLRSLIPLLRALE